MSSFCDLLQAVLCEQTVISELPHDKLISLTAGEAGEVVDVTLKAPECLTLLRLQTLGYRAEQEVEIYSNKTVRECMLLTIEVERRKNILYGIMTEIVHKLFPAEREYRDAIYCVDHERKLIRQRSIDNDLEPVLDEDSK